LPRTVGVVTSSTGAAIRDCINILRARAPNVRIVVSPTKVQGHEAVADIADALRRLDKLGACDVILLVRGGGSLEDLQAFNSEPVARAIAGCRVPVVSGVGHATDHTVADLVADRRAETPSNAAELAVPVVAELEVKLDSYAKRLASSVRPLIDRRRRVVGENEARMQRALVKRRDGERSRLAKLEQRVRARAPDRVLAEKRALLVEMEKRLVRALQKRRDELAQQRRQLDALAARLAPAVARRRASAGGAFELLVARLESISPLTVLGRGYAIARRKTDGHVVRTPSDAPPGTKLTIRVEGGEVDATVDRE
jgi:exodeoxyribonuclease VII large subunit